MRILAFSLLLTLFGCATYPEQFFNRQQVSIIELRAVPSKYDERFVAVAGYLNARENRLFLTTEHRGIEDWSNSIRVSISYKSEELESSDRPTTECNERFVIVFGRWRKSWEAEVGGQRDMHMLQDVYQIAEMKRKKDWGRGPPNVSCWHNRDADPDYPYQSGATIE